MARSGAAAPRVLSAALATELASESAWARSFLGGDPDRWSAAESHQPGMHVVRLSGVLGELDALQPLAADGAVNASSAVAQHLALSGLKAAASPCADTLAFEYMPADVRVLVGPWPQASVVRTPRPLRRRRQLPFTPLLLLPPRSM